MNKRFTNLNVLLLGLPVLGLFYFSLWITIWLWYPTGLSAEKLQAHFQAFSVVYVIWMLVCYAHYWFDVTKLRTRGVILQVVLSAMSINLITAVVYFYFQPELLLTPRRFLLVNVLITTLLVLIWMEFARSFINRRFQYKVYSWGEVSISEDIARNQHLGFFWQGAFDTELSNTDIDSSTVIVTPDYRFLDKNSIPKLYEYLKQGVIIHSNASISELLLRRVPLDGLDEIWFFQSVKYRVSFFYNSFKRLLDFIVGLIFLPLFFILFLVIGPLLKLESKGPVIFKQKRIGKFGKVFTLYKFRTMSGGATNTWTVEGDSRITKIGKWLRRTRADELPQCINLIEGTMSLVGPRPEQVSIVNELKTRIPFYDERHLVLPGITGWSQLHVYASTLEETKLKLEYDLYYIKYRSFLFDLEIILKTLYHLLSLEGK